MKSAPRLMAPATVHIVIEVSKNLLKLLKKNSRRRGLP